MSDGGSTDGTAQICANAGVQFVRSPQKGRGAQLNYGATFASADVLFFMHADTNAPDDFISHILRAISEGHLAGCFRLEFDWNHWFLNFSAWCTRFNITAVRFGDQGLFVTKALFEKIEGYRSDYILLEDQEIIRRLIKKTRLKVLPWAMQTSARKYRENGPIRLQWAFFQVWLNYYLGKPQAELLQLYKRKIKDAKLTVNDTP